MTSQPSGRVRGPRLRIVNRRYGRDAVRLVCLDLAGTTVADGGVVERAFAQALLECDVEPGSQQLLDGLAHVRVAMGRPESEVFGEIFPGEPGRAVAACGHFEAAYDASLARGEVAAVAGAAEAMERLLGMGMALCFTTGLTAPMRDRLLETMGWQDLANLALSPEEVGRGKPYPDMILTAVLRLGIDDVRHVAVVGDTTSDLLAGSRAGAGVVAGVLTGAHDREHLEAVPHTHILESVVELPALLVRACPPPLPLTRAAG
jgi:phosphoglycolate phosphatase